ncbi:methyltransferase [Nitzschia inconspicua]|uniref:Methyltransferase n=1 Tax=Nitzschia inconspicua TaxID=303405 RepID=A0A9K3PTW4_9STRA|nr:methyltransferase [Nitzschia inconspicua]
MDIGDDSPLSPATISNISNGKDSNSPSKVEDATKDHPITYRDLVPYLLQGGTSLSSTTTTKSASAITNLHPTLSLSQLVSVHQSLLELCGSKSNGTDINRDVVVAWKDLDSCSNESATVNLLLENTVQQLWNNHPEIGTVCLDVLRQPSRATFHSAGNGDDMDDWDKQRLWVMQYMLYRIVNDNSDAASTTTVNMLMGLRHIVIPYLLLQKQNNEGEESNLSNDGVDTIVPPSDNLSIALMDLLDVIMTTTMTTSSSDADEATQISVHWNEILTSLVHSSHNNASMLLVRLLRLTSSNDQNVTNSTGILSLDETLGAFYKRLWLLMQQCTEGYRITSGGTGRDWQNDHKLLASLSKYLLMPYMTLLSDIQLNNNKNSSSSSSRSRDTHDKNMKKNDLPLAGAPVMIEPHRSHAMQLRHQLLKWLQDQNALTVLSWKQQQEMLQTSTPMAFQTQQQKQQTVLLVATTVLCPLLPYLIPPGSCLNDALLPHVGDTSDPVLTDPSQLTVLWELIFSCLAQGRWALRDASNCSTNNSGITSMLRRRGLYLLDVVASADIRYMAPLWKDYIMCFEMFELEGERHLVDQIWPVVVKLIQHASQSLASTQSSPGTLTTEWIQLLIGRLLSSEQSSVCKLGMFRVLQVLGREITPEDEERANQMIDDSVASFKEESELSSTRGQTDPTNEKSSSSKQSKKNKKKAQKDQKKTPNVKKVNGNKGKKSLEEIPTALLMRFLRVDTFLWEVLVPSFDNLGRSSVGYTLHFEENGDSLTPSKTAKQPFKVNMLPLFESAIQNYMIFHDSDPTSEIFWDGMWDWDRVLGKVSTKTSVMVYKAASGLFQKDSLGGSSKVIPSLPLCKKDFQSIHASFSNIVKDPSIVISYRRELVHCLAKILANARSQDRNARWSPMDVVSVLTIFCQDFYPLDSLDWSIEQEDTFCALSAWLSAMNEQQQQLDYMGTTGATLASSYVSGLLKPSGSTDMTETYEVWNPLQGYSESVKDLGWAISLFCCLCIANSPSNSASALLWPAIHKGLSCTGAAVLGEDQVKINLVARATLLLEYGCKLRVLSGLGHGDLVLDPKTQQIMPPPPNIEKMLQSTSDFLQWQVRKLLCLETHSSCDASSTRSVGARRLTGTYASLIAQLRTFCQSYPSSSTLSDAMSDLLSTSSKELQLQQEEAESSDDIKTIMLMGLMYTALSSFAVPEKSQQVPMCRLIMSVTLNGRAIDASKAWKQSARSMLQFSKWGCCSLLIPMILKEVDNAPDDQVIEAKKLVADLLNEGINAVTMTPSDALRPLFDCIITTSKYWCDTAVGRDDSESQTMYIRTLGRTINALLSLLEESSISAQSAYFLNETCALIFQTKMMREEYDRLQQNTACDTPILDAFRKLIQLAGKKRPHVSRDVLCQITVGWAGIDDSSNVQNWGLNAIPYRDDIVQLLLHKEDRQEESSTNQSKKDLPTTGVMQIPSDTNETSISRTFVMCFLEKLPDPYNGLNDKVKTELLHYIILQLLDTTKQGKSTSPAAVMIGTPTYCSTMRAWQALVILSRFVTSEIADRVCEIVFQHTLDQQLHSQIRYFVEVFTIQCALNHSDIFGKAFVEEIARTDLSLHHVSSLMIMGGNFILGKYRLEYFAQDEDKVRLRKVLASIIPWLSSTQGFSRGIAQILVYALIPRVVEGIETDSTPLLDSNDWYLRVTYSFLDNNKEMKRLREKQSLFFDEYNIEKATRLEYLMSFPVDDANEANPVHVTEAIKESLKLTYEEAHANDAPIWKQIDQWNAETELIPEGENESGATSTIQRKIIPLDSLNLALEDLREQHLSNAAGTHKQPLIVCASLVDKVPNLGGLARTSEIFAAQSLVVPDLSVTKMDNFKSLSVGAADWIEMEEVNEQNLLPWLLKKKSQGYWIVGLEQTSSSLPIQEISMPRQQPTVLLLGKEKEGIPVQFLQTVDQCMEIPQFGMIRSLNVHVSGAIAIWEFTRQTRL